MAIIDLPTCAGVPMYDPTPIPRNEPIMPKKLGSSDKAAIFLLAREIKQKKANKKQSRVHLDKFQKKGKFPVTCIHSKLLVNISYRVAQDRN